MLNTFIFIIILSLISTDLTPDKDQAVSFYEYEFKCRNVYGKVTFKIYNNQNKNYFLLITPYFFQNFALYANDDDYAINYETSTDTEYFFPINSNYKILYLVANYGSYQCISFKFINTNSLILENNIEFKYPVVTSTPEIKFKARNIYNKHFIFYLTHNYQTQSAGYSIKVDGISYNKYLGTKIFSYIPKRDEVEFILTPPGKEIIATLRYLAVPYTNITDDEIICLGKSDPVQSFFINYSKKARYFWYFLLDEDAKFYDNDEEKTGLSNLDTCYPTNYEHFILLNYSCFQVKYTNDSRKSNIGIKNKDLFLVANTDTYNFIYSRDGSKKNINLTIYSSKNYFIKQLKIENTVQTLEIKENNDEYLKYFYNFIIPTQYREIRFQIKFNISLIVIDFRIEEYIPSSKAKEDNTNQWTVIGIILGVIFGIPSIIFLYKLIKYIVNYYKKKRDEREYEIKRQEKLIENRRFNESIEKIYYSIVRNSEELNKTCLVCLKKMKISSPY